MGIFLKALRDNACVDGFAPSRCYERFYRVLLGIAWFDVSAMLEQLLFKEVTEAQILKFGNSVPYQ
ncbi:MAG: hypothetical protein F6K39_41660 [Okeania sp. SIO3B3]|nr:hypothetical protein [Okeania sp. SIO3B3]